MKQAAKTANKIRTQLDELPSAFSRTVVADYISSLPKEHKKQLINFARRIEDSPKPRKGQLIRAEEIL